MGVSKSILSPENRTKLDGIVTKMQDNQESEDNIRAVVEDFKSQYGEKKNPVGNDLNNGTTETSPSNSSFASKLGERINAAVDSGQVKPVAPTQDKVFGSRKQTPPKKVINGSTTFPERETMGLDGKVSKLVTPDGTELPVLIHFNETPEFHNEEVKKLQNKISTGAIDPFDNTIISSVINKSPEATQAYIKGDSKTGNAIERKDAITKNATELADIVDSYNKEFGADLKPTEILSSADATSKFLQEYLSKLSQSNPIRQKAAEAESQGRDMDIETMNTLVANDSELRGRLQKFNSLIQGLGTVENKIKGHIIEQTAKEDYVGGVSREETVKKIAQRLNPIQYKNTQEALAKPFGFDKITDQSGVGDVFSAIGDEIKGDKDFKHDMLNSVIGEADVELNNTYQKIAADLAAEAHLNNDETKLNEAKLLQTRVDKNITDKYPALQMRDMANELAYEIATEAGQLEGTDTESYKKKILGVGTSGLLDLIQKKGWLSDPKKKPLAMQILQHPEMVKDASYFGGAVDAFIQPFKDLGLSVMDVAGVRDFKDIISDKTKDEFFPKEFAPEETKADFGIYIGDDVKHEFKTRNIVNGISNLAGLTAASLATEGIAGDLGISAGATRRLAAYTSFGVPSIDTNLKDSYNFIDNDAHRAAYVTLGALINGEGGRLLDLGKISRVPGLQEDFKALSKNLVDKKLTETATKELLGKAGNKYIDFATKYGKPVVGIVGETTKGAATMAYFTFANQYNKLLNGDSNTNAADLLPNAANAFMDGVFTMLPFGFVGGLKGTNQNSSYKDMINKFATMPDAAEDAIRLGSKSKEDFDYKMSVINTARVAKNALDATEINTGVTLSPSQRSVYVANKTIEATLREKAKNTVDETKQEQYLKDADALNEQSAKTLDGLKFTPTLEPLYDLYDAEKRYNKAFEDFHAGNAKDDVELLDAKANYERLQDKYLSRNGKKEKTVQQPEEKTFTDFDKTLFHEGKLTALGQEVRDRIAKGEDVTVLTSREDTAENRDFISRTLGVPTENIKAGLDPKGKAAELTAYAGKKVFYDDNPENVAAAQQTDARVVDTGLTVDEHRVPDLFKELQDTGTVNEFLHPEKQTESIEEIQNQALTAPGGLKSRVGKKLLLELIARNSVEDINKSIDKWQDVLKGEDVPLSQTEDADRHIRYLELGLEEKAKLHENIGAELKGEPENISQPIELSIETKPADATTVYEIPDVETHESVMGRAKTGQPIEIDALRIQQSEKSNEDTGTFYGDKGVIEEYQRRQKSGFYGKGNENLFKGDVKQNKLKFENPLVIESKEEFIKELAENGDKEAREVMPDYKETDPAKLVTTHKTHKDFDIFIAKKAREKGHDGIITPLEYVDLRKSEKAPTVSSVADKLQAKEKLTPEETDFFDKNKSAVVTEVGRRVMEKNKQPEATTQKDDKVSQEPLVKLLDDYNNSENGHIGDLVSSVEEYANDTNNTTLLNAVGKYRDQERENLDVWGGRGDTMHEDEFVKSVEDEISKSGNNAINGRGAEPPVSDNIPENNNGDEKYSSIRKEKLAEDIKGAKELFEKRMPKTWSEVYDSALKNVQKMYPNKSLYEAMKARVDYFSRKLAEKELFNPTSEDIAVFNVLKAETLKRVDNVEGQDSDNSIVRQAAIAELTNYDSDLMNIARVTNPDGEAGRAFAMHQSEVNSDSGLKIRRMELMKANGGEPLSPEDEAFVKENWEKEKEVFQQQQQAKTKAMQEDFDNRISDLQKEHEAKIKEIASGNKENTISKKEKTLSQSGKDLADKIRKLKTQKGDTAIDVTLGLKNLAVEAVAQLVEQGSKLAEAIKNVLTDDKYKELTEEDLTNHIIGGLDRQQNKIDAYEKLKDFAEKNDVKDITTEMVGDNIIRDFVNSHIGEVDQKELLNTAFKDLKEVLPNATKEKFIEAYLKENEFKQPTKEQANKAIADAKNELKRIAKDELTADQQQLIKLDREKKNTVKRMNDFQKKLDNNDFEEDKPPIKLRKADAELIRLQKQESIIEEQYRKKEKQIKEKNKSGWERAADFARSLYVGLLIGHPMTLVKVAAASVMRPLSETVTKASFGKVFDKFFPAISKAAKLGGESSSIRSVQEGFKAYFRQMGAKSMEEKYQKANQQFADAAKEYNDYKKTDNPDAKQLQVLKNKMNDKLIKVQGSFIYQFIGGSSLKDALQALMNRSNEIERQFGHVESESIKDGNALDKLNYVVGFLGRSHSAAKTFSGRYSFAAGFMARLEGNVEAGVDISNYDKVLEIAHESYLDWERGKFQQSNQVSDLWNKLTNGISEGEQGTPREGTAKVMAALLKSEVAITRVPVNILHEQVMEYTLGVFRALNKARKLNKEVRDQLISEGFTNGEKELNGITEGTSKEEFKAALKERISQMDEKQAATIARCFRKGGMGVGLYAFALISSAIHFGIFPHLGQKKKKEEEALKEDELNPGQVMVGGHKFGEIASTIIEHSNALWPTFMGVGMAQAYHDELEKGKTTVQAVASSLYTHLKVIEGGIPQFKLVQPLQEEVVKTTKKRLTEAGVIRKQETSKKDLKNYKEGGRDVTDDEFDTFNEKRDSAIAEAIEKLKEGQLPENKVLDEKGNVVTKKYAKMSYQESVKAIAEIKRKATAKVKKELFGEKVLTRAEQRAADRLEAEKEKVKE